jgi:hypothetical protein
MRQASSLADALAVPSMWRRTSSGCRSLVLRVVSGCRRGAIGPPVIRYLAA